MEIMWTPSGLYTLEDFAWFCSCLVLENLEYMELERFQHTLLKPHFDKYAEVASVVPKKNGKSSMVGALALYHMIVVPDAEVILAASARDQAGKMFAFAAGFVRRSTWLQDYVIVQPGYKRIIAADRENDASYIKVVAADANTVDGETPTLAVVDEYHRHKSAELYGILRDGLSAHQVRGYGLLLSISTSGDSEETPLGVLRKSFLELPTMVRDGTYVCAYDEEAGTYYHEWSLPDDADYEDFDLVKQANPLSIHSAASLEKRYKSTSMLLWQWLRFACGIWAGGEFSAFDAIAWRDSAAYLVLEGLKKGENPISEGEWCDLGMDVGWRRDSTALMPFKYDEDLELQIIGVPTVIEAPNDGTATPYQSILDAIEVINDRNPIRAIHFDPNAEGEVLAQMVADDYPHIDIVEYSQQPEPMAVASMALAQDIRAKRLVHPDDSELNNHIMAAGSKPISTGSDRWRVVKIKNGRKIDCAVALSIVRQSVMAGNKKPKLDPDEFVVIAA